MNPRRFFCAGLLLTLVCILSGRINQAAEHGDPLSQHSSPRSHPNIIFILTDDMALHDFLGILHRRHVVPDGLRIDDDGGARLAMIEAAGAIDAHVLEPGVSAGIAGVPVLPLALPHGAHEVLGYRIGGIAYLTDVKAIPDRAIALLQGLEVLVLNALLSHPHPLHLSISEAVTAAQRIGARRTYFTHLTHEFTHAALAAMLPAGIAPAYDGLVIDVDGA